VHRGVGERFALEYRIEALGTRAAEEYAKGA